MHWLWASEAHISHRWWVKMHWALNPNAHTDAWDEGSAHSNFAFIFPSPGYDSLYRQKDSRRLQGPWACTIICQCKLGGRPFMLESVWVCILARAIYVYLHKCLGPSDLSSVSALVSSETIWWSCDLLIHVLSSAWHLSFLYCDIMNVIEQSDSVFLKVLSLFY